MGLTLASVAISLLSVPALPQEQQERKQVLSTREAQSLQKKYQAWMGAFLKWNSETKSKTRIKLAKKRNSAREKFNKEWRSVEKKHGSLLKSVPDLQAVFHDTFPYGTPKGGLRGAVSAQNASIPNAPKYDAFVPKSYKPNVGHRVILVMPGLDNEDEDYEAPRDYFSKTWQGSPICDDTLFILPPIDDSLDLDTTPDFSEEHATEQDKLRRAALFHPAGYAQRGLNFDRNRLILDCGRGSCRFGIRMATYFPTRFAALILRHPEDADLRYDSLCGMPVCLFKNKDTASFVDSLAAKLKELNGDGTDLVKVIECDTADYPYLNKQGEVSDWAKSVKRDLFKQKIVLAPNHDLYHKAYWIEIGTAEPLSSVSKEDRPHLVATVDRAANKINIEAKSVSSFVMWLNDEIVDLEKEVTVVVNGVAKKQLRSRSLTLMQKLMRDRFDPTQLFTVEWKMTVPDPPR